MLSWLVLALALPVVAQDRAAVESDVCVYGGTSGAVIAAVQAARLGKSVALVAPEKHLGGMTSGGLGATDLGRFGSGYIQGLTREFYERMGKHYGKQTAVFAFEPHVAEQVFNEMAREAGVRVYTNQWLAAAGKEGTQIGTLTMTNGQVFRAKMFIDATYEGDLLAKAGVSYCVGREASSQYGESLNGVLAPNTGGHQFGKHKVDPYRVPGAPASGLLPLIQPGSPETPGAADRRVQAYNFRMCLTRTATNRMPIPAPAAYNPAEYELLARYLQSCVDAGGCGRTGVASLAVGWRGRLRCGQCLGEKVQLAFHERA